MYFSDVWYHTTDRGAGRWKNIGANNLWETDHAWMGDELPRELPNGEMTFDMPQGLWSEGTLVWDITWGWAETGRNTGDLPVKVMTTPYNQTFTFTADGTLTVSKFQQTASRGTNGVVRLNGNIVQGVAVTPEEFHEVFGND